VVSLPYNRLRWLACAAAVFVVAVLLVLAAPSAGAAGAQLPVGEADGVRIVRERGAIVVVFTSRAARLYRRIAGKRVSVLCTEFVERGVHSGGAPLRAPKRRRPLRTGDLTRGMDYCRVWLAARTIRRNGERLRRPRELIVSIPLTQRGAVFLDEQTKALDLQSVLLVAGLLADRPNPDTWPTAAELLQSGSGRAFRRRLVALAESTDTPPEGVIGYYSDGQQHVAAVAVSASGRRLFVEWEADVLHTNVANYIYGELF
jgi:hypothetical protein